MTIALRVLAVAEETLRQEEVVLCAGHGDIEQATFLLDLGRGAGIEVEGMQPSTTLSRRPTSPPGPRPNGSWTGSGNLVEQGHAGLIAGSVGRIQREFSQEAFARRISGRDLLGWSKSARRVSHVIDAVEMWFVPEAGTLQIDGPFRSSRQVPAHWSSARPL